MELEDHELFEFIKYKINTGIFEDYSLKEIFAEHPDEYYQIQKEEEQKVDKSDRQNIFQ